MAKFTTGIVPCAILFFFIEDFTTLDVFLWSSTSTWCVKNQVELSWKGDTSVIVFLSNNSEIRANSTTTDCVL